MSCGDNYCPTRSSESDTGFYRMYSRSSDGKIIIKPKAEPDSELPRGSINVMRSGESVYWYNFGDWTHPYYHKSIDQSNLERAIEHFAPTWNRTGLPPSKPLCRPMDVSSKQPRYPPLGPNYKLAHDWDLIQPRPKYSRYTMPDPQTHNFTKQLPASKQYKPMPSIHDQRTLADEIPKLLGNAAKNQEQINAYHMQAEKQTQASFDCEKNQNNSSNLSSEEIGKFHELGNPDSINMRKLTDPKVNKRTTNKESRFHRYMDQVCEPYEADLPLEYDKCEPNIQYQLVQKQEENDLHGNREHFANSNEKISDADESSTLPPFHNSENKYCQNNDNQPPEPESVSLPPIDRSRNGRLIDDTMESDQEPDFSIPQAAGHHRLEAQKYMDCEPNIYKRRLLNEMQVPARDDDSEEYLRFQNLKNLAKHDMINYSHKVRGIPGYTGHQPRQALNLPIVRDICQEEKTDTTVYRDTYCRRGSLRDVVDSHTRLGHNSALSRNVTASHPFNPYNSINPTQRFEVYDWIRCSDRKKKEARARRRSRMR